MAKNIISVVGGTGLQGGGVVDALLSQGEFKVRVASRDPATAAPRALVPGGFTAFADWARTNTKPTALAG